MVVRIVADTGQLPAKLIADAGYCSTGNIETCERRKLDVYVSTSRKRQGKHKAGPVIYALRKTMVEPVFGQIKTSRGLDRFLLRSLKKVNGKWHLIAITHNLGKLHRAALAGA